MLVKKKRATKNRFGEFWKLIENLTPNFVKINEQREVGRDVTKKKKIHLQWKKKRGT